DPLAAAALTWPLSLVARLGKVPGVRSGVLRIIDGRWPGVRTSLVARARVTHGGTARAGEEPIEQAVILGAGFDSRAYRLPGLRRLAVFEVDHPATQAAKPPALERALPPVPDHGGVGAG